MANKLESGFSAGETPKDKALSKAKSKKSETPNYTKIANSPEFQSLKSKKRKFIVPVSIFFLVCYITLPLLTSYSTILNTNAFGDVAWVWVYALSLFIMTWVLCMVYVRRANRFDQEADAMIEKEKAGGYE